MEIKRGAEADLQIDANHDRQKEKLESGPDRGDSEGLQHDEDRENGDVEFFALEHYGDGREFARKRGRSVAASRDQGKRFKPILVSDRILGRAVLRIHVA